jgi:uncharacterized LabA/DUF88 family protein
MSLRKTLFFLDFANINRTANDKNIQLDYKHLKSYMGEDRDLLDSYSYVPKDPRNEHKFDREIEGLQKAGYFITTKIGTYAGDTYKCDFDVEMAIDITKMAHLIRPDIIVIATGDSDMIPIVKELRRMGIRVEIAAFNSSMSKQLRLEATSFVDLDIYYQSEYFDAVDESENGSVFNDEFPIPEEEIEIATEIMEDAGIESYIFEQNKRFTIVKDNEIIRESVEVIKEFTNDFGTYLIYQTIDYTPN